MTLLFKQEQLAALNEEGICAMIDCLRACCLLKALELYHFETGMFTISCRLGSGMIKSEK